MSDARLDNVDARLTGVDSRFNNVDERLNNLDGRLSQVERRAEHLPQDAAPKDDFPVRSFEIQMLMTASSIGLTVGLAVLLTSNWATQTLHMKIATSFLVVAPLVLLGYSVQRWPRVHRGRKPPTRA